MHQTAPASVIVVSRERPDALARCLAGLWLMDHPRFEVIVVACPAGLAAVDRTGLAGRIKTVAFDEANISAARNLGIREAAGEICAFIDDDAVPEPTWLSRLCAPFDDRRTAAAGGFVRGRNGISFQWKARAIDATGQDHAIPLPDDEPVLQAPPPGMAIKTEGTNMAFRRRSLAALGGFDPAYRFYLDEADLNMRLMQAGGQTALVPLAQVHHGYLASARRRRDRTPTDLHEIGASVMVFLRRFAPAARHGPALDRLRDEQRRRILRLMVSGQIEPRDVARLLATLETGIAEGAARPLDAPPPVEGPESPFLLLRGTGLRPSRVFAGWVWQKRALARAARAAAREGAVVTVFRFGLLPRPHRMRFLAEGYWEQSGGLWGRSDRTGPAVRRTTLAERLAAESERLAPLRGIDTLLS